MAGDAGQTLIRLASTPVRKDIQKILSDFEIATGHRNRQIRQQKTSLQQHLPSREMEAGSRHFRRPVRCGAIRRLRRAGDTRSETHAEWNRAHLFWIEDTGRFTHCPSIQLGREHEPPVQWVECEPPIQLLCASIKCHFRPLRAAGPARISPVRVVSKPSVQNAACRQSFEKSHRRRETCLLPEIRFESTSPARTRKRARKRSRMRLVLPVLTFGVLLQAK
jgi:hypothetical protein